MLARQQPANLPQSSLLEESSSSSSSPLIPCKISSPDSDVRNDSGVSTMKSVCSKQMDLTVPITVLSTTTTMSTVQTLADILYSNHNNNYTGTVDVVELLQLRSVDDEQNQQSNSSSLESLASLENCQGSETAVADGASGTTSCSDDSFEMSSTCSVRDIDISPEMSQCKDPCETNVSTSQCQHDVVDREVRESTCESFCSTECEQNKTAASAESPCNGDLDDRYSNLFLLRQPPSSISMDSFMMKNAHLKAIRENINLELQNLDTGLPVLDFVKLEEQLTNAAREREEHDRKLLGEEVRRRLALQADSWKGASPAISTRPHRSNLALRLQTAMNLQVCYMNELAESASESEISESEDEFIVPRSRSTPDLKGTSRPGSSKEDPYLQKLRDQAFNDKHLDQFERQTLLNGETRRVLRKAKKVAEMALQRYRSTKSKASDVPRQARQYLRKMSLDEVSQIKATIEEAIDRKNLELMELLIERDSLHMEHDSLLVDIEDFTEHEAECSALDFPYLLNVMDGRIAPESHFTKTSGSWNNRCARGNMTDNADAPTPTRTPTSPTKTLVAHLPKSLTRLVLFRR